MPVYSVSAVTRYLKEVFDSDVLLQDIWIAGEISNWSVSSLGHAYFTLKDANSQMKCVLFKGRRAAIRFQPSSGDEVIAHGRLSVYEPAGTYQLMVDMLQPQGVGELHLQFELLRARLEQEGLFDAARKRPLPRFPRRIGVVTSATGSVLHDIITVVGRRYPLAELLLAPTLVQGAEAAGRIAAAIESLNEVGDVDVLILARGGGSIEDLWPFNEEIVARAIFASRVPVVSGVGHETDYTIADFVADVRAATPSAAAELVTPDLAVLRAQITAMQRDLDAMFRRQVEESRASVARLARSLERSSPGATLERRRQQTDDLARRAQDLLNHCLSIWRAKLQGRALQLSTLDPLAVLARGYSVCRRDGHIVGHIGQVAAGDEVTVQVSDGIFGASVGHVPPLPRPGPSAN